MFTSARACVCENVCVSLGTGSFVGTAGHFKGSRPRYSCRDLAGLQGMSGTCISVCTVWTRVCVCECVFLHHVYAYCGVMSELRHVQISLPQSSTIISHSSSGSESTGQTLDLKRWGLEELKPE